MSTTDKAARRSERRLRDAIKAAMRNGIDVQAVFAEMKAPSFHRNTVREAVAYAVETSDDFFWCNYLAEPLASAHVANRICNDAFREKSAMCSAEFWRQRGRTPIERCRE